MVNDEAVRIVVAILALLRGLRLVLALRPGRPAREPAVRRGVLCCVEGSTANGGAFRHYRYQPSMPWLATPAGGQFSSFMPS
ncbi:hypothetical protein AAP84_25880, partial [Salmonella enterica subsp. enterica]|nr:hypothetical protein [Salmonella enterica subsp. enterica serovar Litchfield]